MLVLVIEITKKKHLIQPLTPPCVYHWDCNGITLEFNFWNFGGARSKYNFRLLDIHDI